MQYDLFHGHGSSGTQADRTNYHEWKPDQKAFANGTEQLLAIAPMITTKK